MTDAPATEDDLRDSLSSADPRVRLRAAWTLAARTCPPELSAAWGLVGQSGGTDEAEPSVEQRRVFPMALSMGRELGALAVLAEHDTDSGVRATACQCLARTATPDDAESYAVLSRVATHDTSNDVRAAVASNLREDAPEDVRRSLKTWMRGGSADMERATVEAVFATSESPGAFLNRMRDEPVRRVQYALALLREKRVAVEWSDVSKRIEHRSFPVLLELARLFADRPEAAPLSFWLRCATFMKDIVELPEKLRTSFIDAMGAACQAGSPDTLQSPEDADVLHRALTVLVDLLPKVAHNSYMELKKAGAIPYASSVKPAGVESGFARLWVAMIRLSPKPSFYVLRPRYR